jgi:LPXTG-motif cell wall-anchored protein
VARETVREVTDVWRGAMALVAATALALAALPGRTSADQEVTIRAGDFHFEPHSFTASVGETVRFTVINVGARPHNVEFELESADIEALLFDTNLQPGETRTAEFTFTQAGTWEMYCPVGNHKEQGMVGEVNVVAAAGAAPKPAAPPAAAPKPAAPVAQPAPSPAPAAKPAAPVTQPAPSPAPAVRPPSQLPRTGGAPGLGAAVAVAGLALLGGGFLVRRRR